MTLTRNDVIDVLSACAAGDNRKVGNTDVEFWAATLRPELTRDDALEAVRVHYMNTSDRAMPAHINTIARQIRRDRVEREHSAQLIRELESRPANYGQANPAAGGLPIPTEGAPVWAAYQVNGALDRECVRCEARPQEACIIPGKTPTQTLKIPCLDRMVDRKIKHAAKSVHR